MKRTSSISRRDFLRLGCAMAGAAVFSEVSPFPLVCAESRQLGMAQIPPDWQAGLDRCARSFISCTPEFAAQAAKALLQNETANASLICGPLSLAPLLGLGLSGDLLQQRGVAWTSGIRPPDMWLASPDGESTDARLFDMAFDPRLFEHDEIRENILRHDFTQDELLPGDFLFLNGGSYTHFITISRVDSRGRVFAVTNIPNENGQFVIAEKMLWDPELEDGFIRNFSTGIGPKMVYTGRKGFHRWRRKADCFFPVNFSKEEQSLNFSLTSFFQKIVGKWNVLIADLDNDKTLFEWRSRFRYHPASTIKVALALAAMKAIETEYAEEIQASGLAPVITERGFEKRTFQQLFQAMLTLSEEEASDSLTRFAQSAQPMVKWFEAMGLEFTNEKPRRSCQADLLRCWNLLHKRAFISAEGSAFIMAMLSAYTKNDDSRLGLIKTRIPDARIWNKRGTIVNVPYTLQDCGIIQLPRSSRSWYVGIAGTLPDGVGKHDDRWLQAKIEEACLIIAEYLKGVESDYA